MNIVNYLINKGYKPMRYTKNGWIEDSKNVDFFSTASEGKLTIRLVKDNSMFEYGLNEYGLPPTLIFPLPQNVVVENITEGKGLIRLFGQHDMQRFLEAHSLDEVFEILYPNSII